MELDSGSRKRKLGGPVVVASLAARSRALNQVFTHIVCRRPPRLREETVEMKGGSRKWKLRPTASFLLQPNL